MTVARTTGPEWLSQSERSTVPIIRFIVWVALRLGRPVARAMLYPICLYYVIFAPRRRALSAGYLWKVLGRKPSARDVFRHFYVFAACLLDRVFLLADRSDELDIHVYGEDIVSEVLARGDGCFLLGGHLGSFDVVRAHGKKQPKLTVALATYEGNAVKINSVLNSINPKHTLEVIPLGRQGSMMQVKDRLDGGSFIGILADRSLVNEKQKRFSFLGEEAGFPIGPFRIAAVLKQPIVFMVGLYRGGRRYDIHFERLADLSDVSAADRTDGIERAMSRYVERLQHYCLSAPYNWFNFYDFWK
jgi:predicted LPLAT superfamily acyltransferase